MPETLTDARKLASQKLSVPSEMRTAEWAMLPQWLRERAFYMAGVHQAEILDEFRAEAEAIAQGQSSIAESERKLTEFLEEINYEPLPGQEGTIKDLRSWRRMRVALRTNVELLQGWGQKERGMRRGALMAAPAWELVRIMPRQVPRDWQQRWADAGGEVREDGRMIAMKDDEVWQRLGNLDDGLGVDYPPFAWGSGMGWRAIGAREAARLEVLQIDWTPPPRKPIASPNAALVTTPKISDRALRDELVKRMRGLAEWRGEKLVFTDPNGSQKTTGASLVKIWNKGMPETFSQLPGKGLIQAEALKLWVENHNDFIRKKDRNGVDVDPPPGRLNLYDDLLRLFERLVPLDGAVKLYRGMAFGDKRQMDSFLGALSKSKLYVPLANKPGDSWSIAQSGARKYQASKGFSVRLVCSKHHTAKDLTALVRSIKGLRNPNPDHPLVTDGEVIFTQGAKFRIIKIVRGKINEKGGVATVYVEQF